MTSSRNARFTTALLLGAAAAALATGSAMAQVKSAAQPAADQLEEIVVTARRVKERLQDVPLSVAAVSTAELAKRQIQNVNDIADTIPNLSIAGSVIPGAAAIVIRGISSNVLPDVSLDSSVGHYVDGVYVARLTAGGFSLADLSRLEVVRGPQGTLFGRNVTQGAINFITADPSGRPHAELEGTVGDYNRYRFRAMVETPEWHGLSLRAAYVHDQRDGDIKNPIGGGTVTFTGFGGIQTAKTYRSQDDNGYFFAAKYTGINNLTVTYKFDKADDNDAPPDQQIAGIPGNSTYAGLIDQYHLIVGTKEVRSNPTAFSGLTTIHDYGHNLTVEYQVRPDVALKSITAVRGNYTLSDGDTSGGALLFAPNTYLNTLGGPGVTKQQQISQELQVIAHEKRFDFTGGLYFFKEWGGINYTVFDGGFYGPLGGRPLSTVGVNTVGGPPFGVVDDALNTVQQATNQSYAGYAHTDIHVTDNFDLSGGVRYTKDDRTNVANSFNVIALSMGKNPLTVGELNRYHKDNVSYDVTGTYKVMPDVKAYVRYATGYLSGGFRGVSPFQPESTKAVEVGLKSEWLEHRLRINADYFHIDTTNFQVTQFTFQNGTQVINVAGYHSDGAEWESSFTPISGLNLEWDWGYNNTVYSDGRRPGAPRFNTNFSGDYKAFTFSNGSYISLRADTNFRSVYYGPACALTEIDTACKVTGGGGWDHVTALDPTYLASQGYGPGLAGTKAYLQNLDKAMVLGDYWVVNLRGSLMDIPMSSGHARASVWVKNLLDERGAEGDANFGSFLGTIFEPGRTIGIDLAWSY